MGLSDNLDFKRAIAQQFDPSVDYSDCDAATVEGAFEATVLCLLQSSIKTEPEFRAIIHRVIKWNGLEIGLEHAPGEVRFPHSQYAKKLRSGYGHIRGYKSQDKEALDCYVAPAFFDGGESAGASERLFEVSQIKPDDGELDEVKMMAGYKNLEHARQAFLTEMPKSHFGSIREIKFSDLKQYLNRPTDFSETDIKAIVRITLAEIMAESGKAE